MSMQTAVIHSHNESSLCDLCYIIHMTTYMTQHDNLLVAPRWHRQKQKKETILYTAERERKSKAVTLDWRRNQRRQIFQITQVWAFSQHKPMIRVCK